MTEGKKAPPSHIPYSLPHITGKEANYVNQVFKSGHLMGGGDFTRKCHHWLEQNTGCAKALLTTSCTTALEMAALVCQIGKGDEVIMPSFTFVSTANAFALRGATPVFVDIRPDTLNIDESLIEAAITPRTKAIVPVHYAGVGCEMDAIMAIAKRHGLSVIEDAAQGVGASYHGKALGAIGRMGAYSFHGTKNIGGGEGGALLLNNPDDISRAEIAWEKGTNRTLFDQGKVDKYSWVDLGSSFLPSDILAAFLLAQLEESETINNRRRDIWTAYYEQLVPLVLGAGFTLPVAPDGILHNGHIFYMIAPDHESRNNLIAALKAEGIYATSHYVPLHSSPGGKKYGRSCGDLPVTDDMADRIIRLPLWIGMEESLGKILSIVEAFCAARK